MEFFWIILYGLAYSSAEWIVSKTGASDWIVPAVMCMYLGCLLTWCVRSPRRFRWGVRSVQRMNGRKLVEMLPLLTFPVYNLVTSRGIFAPGPVLVVTCCAAAAEEVLFRCFLLGHLREKGALFGVIVSSAVFALMHAANLMQSAAAEFVAVQMLSAFAVGVCYSLTAIRYDSVLPCMAAHILTNLTAGPSGGQTGTYAGALLCTGICIVYGFMLSKLVFQKEK